MNNESASDDDSGRTDSDDNSDGDANQADAEDGSNEYEDEEQPGARAELDVEVETPAAKVVREAESAPNTQLASGDKRKRKVR